MVYNFIQRRVIVRNEHFKKFLGNKMLRKRVIPTLSLLEESLVKTIRFNKFNYIEIPATP